MYCMPYSYFGTFVRLAKQIMLSHLIHLARDSVSQFVDSLTVTSTERPREGYLLAAFVFAPVTGKMISHSFLFREVVYETIMFYVT
jgi:hypothetical protein